MSKTLALVAAVGFALCIGFFALAFLIAGDQVFHFEKPLSAIRPLVDLATRKEWHWDGGDTLAVEGPVVLHYQPDGLQRVTVTGPADIMQHVQVGGGQISSGDMHSRRDGRKLDAVIGGVHIRKFRVAGNQDLELGHVDQDNLDIHMSGKGSVSGEGRVEKLNMVLAGKNDVNLGGLSAQDVKMIILGDTEATLSPHRSLVLTIAGHGLVRLLTHPESIQKIILGSGRIIEAGMPDSNSAGVAVNVFGSPAPPSPPGPPEPMRPEPMRPEPMRTEPMRQASNSRSFTIGGNGSQRLGHFEGGAVKLMLTGSGSAEADGQVDQLSLQVAGSGKARLGALSARQADVTIAGSGSATIAPSEEAHITIFGSGNVYLATRPRKLDQNIMGSGRIIERY